MNDNSNVIKAEGYITIYNKTYHWPNVYFDRRFIYA